MFIQPTHLYEALGPLFLISNLVGTSPIYFKKNNENYSLKSSNVFKIITFLYLSLYTSSIVYGTQNLNLEQNNRYFNNAMTVIGVALDIVGQIVLIYIIYIFSLFISKSIQKAIGKIANMDAVLRDMGHVYNYRNTLLQSISVLTGGLAVIVYTSVMHVVILPDHSPFSTNSSLWFIYYFPNLIIFVMECQFACVVFLIYQRFQAINKILGQMSRDGEFEINNHKIDVLSVQSIKSVEAKQQTSIRKIETLMELYDTAVDIASEINNNYSFQVLVCLTALFIKLVFGINFAYLELFVFEKPPSSINWMTWSAMNVFEILLIVVPCYITSLEAQQTGVDVHKLLLNTQSVEVREKLVVFSQQIFHCPVEFTACGLFPIDAPLLFTVVSAGATYLIIMLQFHEDAETSCMTSGMPAPVSNESITN